MGISVICSTCNHELQLYQTEMDTDGNIDVRVAPCAECIKDEKAEADKAGYNRGHEDGIAEGGVE